MNARWIFELSRPRFGLLALALTLLTGCQTKESSETPSAATAELPQLRTRVLEVAPTRWPAVVRAQGSLIADEVTVIGAKVAGRVAELSVDLGDAVTEDALLASLDDRELQLEVMLAKAQLLQARAALGLDPAAATDDLTPENAPPVREAAAVWDETRLKTARLQQLRAGSAISAEELEQAMAAEQVAGARHAAALNSVLEKIAHVQVRSAEISLAEQRLRDAQIRAPFAGRVLQRHVAPGTYVQVGAPIVTLVRTARLRFRGTVPERHAHRLEVGQQVSIQLSASAAPIASRIARLSPGIEQQVRSLVFEADIDNRDGKLGPGLFAEAEIVVDPEAKALLIPQSALIEFAGTEKVWLVRDGIAQEQPVRTGRRREHQIEILVGLQAGDQVLADGASGQVARIEIEQVLALQPLDHATPSYPQNAAAVAGALSEGATAADKRSGSTAESVSE